MMPSLENDVLLLAAIAALNARFLTSVQALLDCESLRELTLQYKETMRKREVDLGFNAFSLVSEVYHRENLHSDVIRAILDPEGAHKQGVQYLRLFLEFLRDRHGVKLRLEDYDGAKVEREPGRIDLLVRGKVGDKSPGRPKAIIIENKINGAGDMNRQVVRYLETVEDKWKYACDAVIYLSLDLKKKPDRVGWSKEEKSRVKPLLIPVCAFNDSNDDLYHGWLIPCTRFTAGGEVSHVIQQYSQLILKLGRNAMNKPLMENFYNLMQEHGRYTSALSLMAMLNDLPAFRCQKMLDAFQDIKEPFSDIRIYQTFTLVFEGLGTVGPGVKIHVNTSSQEKTRVSFWDQNDPEGNFPKKILLETGQADTFARDEGWFNRDFAFPTQDEEVCQFIREFLKRLTEYMRTRIE